MLLVLRKNLRTLVRINAEQLAEVINSCRQIEFREIMDMTRATHELQRRRPNADCRGQVEAEPVTAYVRVFLMCTRHLPGWFEPSPRRVRSQVELHIRQPDRRC